MIYLVSSFQVSSSGMAHFLNKKHPDKPMRRYFASFLHQRCRGGTRKGKHLAGIVPYNFLYFDTNALCQICHICHTILSTPPCFTCLINRIASHTVISPLYRTTYSINCICVIHNTVYNCVIPWNNYEHVKIHVRTDIGLDKITH